MRRHGGGLPIERFAALRRAKDIIGQAALAWIEHDASTMGAALAFYTVFSVAPILIIAIGVLELLVGTDTVKAELLPQMQILFGDAGASAVQALLLSATLMGNSHIATLVGLCSSAPHRFLSNWRRWIAARGAAAGVLLGPNIFVRCGIYQDILVHFGDSQEAESLVRATAHRRCGDAGLSSAGLNSAE
jgi:hypothetical protein